MSGSLRAITLLLGILLAVCLAVRAGWGVLLVGLLLATTAIAAWMEGDQ